MPISVHWHVDLPQALPVENVNVRPVDGRIRFQTDTGASIITSVFTEEPVLYEVSRHVFREYQWNVLQDWWHNTIGHGVRPFIWGAVPEGIGEDPFGVGTGHKVFRFVERPQYEVLTPPMNLPEVTGAGSDVNPQRRLAVSYSLEELPFYQEAQ